MINSLGVYLYSGQNKLSPMSVFSIGIMFNFPKFISLFQKYIKQLKILTQIKLDNNILGVIT